jgi:hypothetical protein
MTAARVAGKNEARAPGISRSSERLGLAFARHLFGWTGCDRPQADDSAHSAKRSAKPTSMPLRAWLRKCFGGTCDHCAALLPCTRTSHFRWEWFEMANHVNDCLTPLRRCP